MKTFKQYYGTLLQTSSIVEDAGLLIVRFVLAFNFFEPAINKLGNIASTAEFFSQIGIPFSTLNAYLAGSFEMLAVILLPLGLGVRLVSFPLIFVMGVAVATLHWEHGWSAGNNGMEIPVYYALFFLLFIARGAGKFSLDYLLLEKTKESE